MYIPLIPLVTCLSEGELNTRCRALLGTIWELLEGCLHVFAVIQ